MAGNEKASAFVKKVSRYSERTIVEQMLGAIPVIFESAKEYADWKNSIIRACRLTVDLHLVGSVVFGFSLAPAKFGRAFSREGSEDRPASDLDLAVVDTFLFTEVWDTILNHDRALALRAYGEQKEKMMQSIYYGFITDYDAPRDCLGYRKLLAIRSASGVHATTSGLKVTLRLYRRSEDLYGYQIASLKKLKREVGL
jgi:hypothetical protein